MKREDALTVAAELSFSLWPTTIVASTSRITTSPRLEPTACEAGSPSGSCDHAWRRTLARALAILLALPE